MATTDHTRDLAVALRSVHLASLLTKAHLLAHLENQSSTTSGDVLFESKSDASEVTVADFASQALLIGIIHKLFPEDNFIAEESSELLRKDEKLLGRVWDLMCSVSVFLDDPEHFWQGEGDVQVESPQSKEEMMQVIDLGAQDPATSTERRNGRTWILDPIDGTKTFIRGQQYAVCLCLVQDGEQRVAVLGCPNLKLDIDLTQKPRTKIRPRIEESYTDLRANGGWLITAIKGQGTYIYSINFPTHCVKVDDIFGGAQSAHAGASRRLPPPPSAPRHSYDGPIPQPPQSTTNTPRRTLLFTDSAASPHVSNTLHATVFNHFSCSSALDLWSMQLKYVLLALRAERGDVMIRVPPDVGYHAAVWDHAGGQLLLSESGGVLTDALGRNFVIDGSQRKLVGNWGVCAVRGGFKDARTVHEEVLGVVKEETRKREERRRVGKEANRDNEVDRKQ